MLPIAFDLIGCRNRQNSLSSLLRRSYLTSAVIYILQLYVLNAILICEEEKQSLFLGERSILSGQLEEKFTKIERDERRMTHFLLQEVMLVPLSLPFR